MGFPLYWLRALGAGDVKLIGMVGAFLGGPDTFAAVLVIFAVGGVLGAVAVARHHALWLLVSNPKHMVSGGMVKAMAGSEPPIETLRGSAGVLPYGVAIAAGTILYLPFMKASVLL